MNPLRVLGRGRRKTRGGSRSDDLRRAPFSLQHTFLQLGRADRLTWADAMTSVWLAGAAGSGKSSAVLSAMIISALRAGASVVFTTVKPSDPSMWTRICRNEGRSAQIFELGVDRFNPLAHVQRTASPGAAIDAVTAECLVPLDRQRHNGGGDPHWRFDGSRFTRSIITPFVLADISVTFRLVCDTLLNLPRTEEETYTASWRERCPAFAAIVAAQERIVTATERDQLDRAARFLLHIAPNLPHRTRESTVSTVCAPLDPFAAPGLVGDTLNCDSDTWDPAECLQAPQAVVFDAAMQAWGPAGATVQRFLLNAVQRAALTRDLDAADHPLVIVADEAQEFLDHEADAAFMRTCRDRRACMLLATQCVGNIADAASSARDPHAAAQKLLGLGGVKIFTATTDPATTRFASEVFAQRWQPRISFGSQDQNGPTSPGQSNRQGRSSNISRELTPDVAPHELLSLARGGPENAWIVEAFISCSGRLWSSGRSSIKVAFAQTRM